MIGRYCGILGEWLVGDRTLLLLLHVSPLDLPRSSPSPPSRQQPSVPHAGIDARRSLKPTSPITAEGWHEAAPRGYTRPEEARGMEGMDRLTALRYHHSGNVIDRRSL